jgi:outer membrane murein-binding lipoprotein Lpp
MEKNKKVRLYFMGKRKKDIYLNMTKWEVFKLKVKNTVRSLVIVAMIVGVLCLFYYAGGMSNLAQNAHTTQVKEVLIDNLTPKINELKTAILNEIKTCESMTQILGILKFNLLVLGCLCSRNPQLYITGKYYTERK